jgi:6-phosphogluconolactonase
MNCSFFSKNTFFSIDRENASNFLSNEIRQHILKTLDIFGKVFLILTGGNTIHSFLKGISTLDIPWGKVTIFLSDERMVPDESEYSNEGQIKREFFIYQNVPSANFLSIKNLYKQNIGTINEFFYKIAPMSVCVLSVGMDGHVASLFPEDKITLKSEDALIKVNRPDFERLTLSLKFFEMIYCNFIIIGNKQKLDFLRQLNVNDYPFRDLFKCSHKIIITE